jgi:hypothetical protein
MLSDSALLRLAQSATLLEELDISGCAGVSSASVAAVLSCCSVLRVLRMSRCPGVCDPAFAVAGMVIFYDTESHSRVTLTAACVASWTAALVEVDLSDTSVTDVGLSMLLRAAPGLQVLHAAHTPISGLGLATCFVLRGLRDVDLSLCAGIGDDAVAALAGCPDLEHVVLRGCGAVTDGALAAAVSHWIALRVRYALCSVVSEGLGEA